MEIIILIATFFTGVISTIVFQKASGWSKWKTVEKNKEMEMVQTNPITGYISRGRVYVDVLMKRHRSGKVKYKSVPRS